MLSLRYARSGRRNLAFFRIVLTEKSKPCDSGYIKILGWYNPHTKETSLDKEEVLLWVNKGAKVSNSLAKLLISQGIKHKNISFVKDTPKAKKEKKEGGAKAQPKTEPGAGAENSDQAQEEKVAETDKKDNKEQAVEEEQPAEQEKNVKSEQETKPEEPSKPEVEEEEK